jgi:hypothetical protein
VIALSRTAIRPGRYRRCTMALRTRAFLLSGAAFAGLLSLTACVTAKTTHMPSGKTGYAIHCNGAMHDISDCMDKAAEVCGGPYQIFTSTGEVVASTAFATGVSPNTAVATSVNGIHRTLIVECGAPTASATAK